MSNDLFKSAFGSRSNQTKQVDPNDIWRSQILPNLDDEINKPRTQKLIWAGIDPSVRGDVWSALVGDQLGITKEDYTKLVQQGQMLLKSNQQLEGLVMMDIERTFPSLSYFKRNSGSLFQPLFETLCAFIAFRADFGYVQGVSYLAAMVHLHMKNSPYMAFVTFTNLISIVENFQLANTENPDLNPACVVFRNLLKSKLPRVASHLARVGVTADQYIFTWFIPIFCHGATLEISARIWDNYLYSGDCFLFRCALGIMSSLEEVLLNAQYEAALYILQNFGEFVDASTLFKNVDKFDVTYDQMLQASRLTASRE